MQIVYANFEAILREFKTHTRYVSHVSYKRDSNQNLLLRHYLSSFTFHGLPLNAVRFFPVKFI